MTSDACATPASTARTTSTTTSANAPAVTAKRQPPPALQPTATPRPAALASAFPVPAGAQDTGASMRDWFAANALQGLVARGLEVSGDRVLSDLEKANEMATRAYRLADAMIKIRQQTLS